MSSPATVRKLGALVLPLSCCLAGCSAESLSIAADTLAATPASNASFTGRAGAATGTANRVTVVMDGSRSLTATFAPASTASSRLPVPPGGGVPRPSGTPGNLKVLDWAGFAGAVSYTFDDSQPSQIEHYADLQATGVPMTFYITSSRAGQPSYDATFSQAVRDGHEIGNHTVNHCAVASLSRCRNSYPTALEEIDHDTSYIVQHFGQTGVWTMASPYGDSAWDPYAQQRFIVNRGVGVGMIAPRDDTDPFDLPAYMAGSSDSAGTFGAAIDNARKGGKWLIYCIHTIGPTSNVWNPPVDISAITGSIAHAKSLGDVWVGTVAAIGAYWRAQATLSSVYPTVSGNTRTWSWTLPPHFPKGRYLRVKVDGGTLTQGGNILPWDGHGYYEVALDAGSVTLSP
jgi:peptidoglycan/xylan/chitin deacetylase (PgdA/CDA1 family)